MTTNPTTFEYDVFISYNQHDEAWAKQLATRLEQEDWQGRKLKVFFAPWDIKPGESIPERLEYALPRSRKVCLIMSPQSAASEWVKVERYVTHHIDITERQLRLIPLYRRASEIPPFLQHINRIDFQDDAKFEEGYRLLLGTIKDEPLPRGEQKRIAGFTKTHNPPTSGFTPQPPEVKLTVERSDEGFEKRSEPNKSIDVFYSYSHRDETLRDELEKHLSMLKRQGIITSWHDRRIGAGRDWEGQIHEHINSSHIILLLISSDFLASDYCYDLEVKHAVARHQAGRALVIPIILRACDWTHAPFGKLQALPKDAKPVKKWEDLDEAFTDIAQGLRQAISELQKTLAVDLAGSSATDHPSETSGENFTHHRKHLRRKLIELRQFEQEELIDESVKKEYTLRLLNKWIEEE